MTKYQSMPSDWQVESYIVMEGEPLSPVTYFKAFNRLTGAAITGQPSLSAINALIKATPVSYEEAEVQIASNGGPCGISRRDGTTVGNLEKPVVITAGFTLGKNDSGSTFIYTGAGNITITIPAELQVPFNCRFIQGGAGTISVSSTGITTIGDTGTAALKDVLQILGYATDTYFIRKN